MKFLKRIRAVFNFKGKRAEMELTAAEIRGNKVFMHPADDPDHTFCISGKAIDIVIDPTVALTENDFTVLSNTKLDTLQSATEIDPQATVEQLLQPKAEDQTNNPTAQNPPEKPHDTLSPDEKEKATQKELSKANSEVSDPNTESKTTQTQNGKKAAEKSDPPSANDSYTYPKPQMRTVSMRLYQDEYDLLMEAIEEKGYKKTEYLLACVTSAKKKSMETNYQKYYAERMRRRKEQRAEAAKARAEQEMRENNASA